jgi:hypothetical protein
MATPNEPNVADVANRVAQNIMESQSFGRFMPTGAEEFEGMHPGAIAVMGMLMWQVARLQVALEGAGILPAPPPPGTAPTAPPPPAA